MATALIQMPPDPAPLPNARPYDLIREHIEDLFSEAKNHADGDPIASPGQAEAVQTLLRQIQAAKKAADAERVKENGPFDAGKAEVQARYASLIGDTKAVKGKAVLAEDVLKAHLLPWQVKLADEQRAVADAARAEAERVTALAAEAARNAAANDLDAREAAEELVTAAKAADKAAKAAETARPQVSGQGRAATLRTSYRAVMTDAQVAAGGYWKRDPSAFTAFLQSLADADVAAGRRDIPGFTVETVRSVV